MNKRGQELSIGTLVLIVLGVIVLVLLVLGFSMGWQNLFSKIGIYQGSDLSSMVAACKVAVASQSTVSYCEFKSVRLSDGKKEINCEYNDVEKELGADKLSSRCSTDNYCTEVEIKDGQVVKKDNKPVRKANGMIKGLKSPCPPENNFYPIKDTVL